MLSQPLLPEFRFILGLFSLSSSAVFTLAFALAMSSSSKSPLTISTGAGDFASSRGSEQQRADMDGIPGYLHDIVEGDDEPMAFSPEAGTMDVRVLAVGPAS